MNIKKINKNIKNKDNMLLKTLAMPNHTNANGNIFGGWIMSQMDMGGAILAKQISLGRVVTAQAQKVSFTYPISIGDIITCYGKCIKIGTSSMKIKIEIWVTRLYSKPIQEEYLATYGKFIYVAVDKKGKPRKIFHIRN